MIAKFPECTDPSSLLVDKAAVALEHGLLVQQLELLEIIAKGRPLRECLEALTAAAARLSPRAQAAVVVANDDRNAVERTYSAMLPVSFGERLHGAAIRGRLVGPLGSAIRRGQSVACDDVLAERGGSHAWQTLCVSNGIRACHATPIFSSQGIPLGSFALLFSSPHAVEEWERQIGQFGAHVASIAIERDRTMRALRDSRENLQAELRDLKQLQALSAALIHEDNVGAIYEAFVDAVGAIMGSDFASMQMFYPERGEAGELRLLASRGFSPEAQEYWRWVGITAGSSCAESLRTRTRTIASDLSKCSFTERRNDRAAFEAGGIGASQSTPLFSRKGELLGMISTHWKRQHQPAEHDLRLLDILARQAADVIERRLAANALRDSEERFRAFVATSSDVVYRMSADWSEMRYLDGRDFIADTSSPSRGWIHKYIHPDDQARVWARINEAIASKSPFDLEHRVIRVDGTLGWVHSRAIPLLDENGAITEWFGAAGDVTLKKQAEAQQQQLLRNSQRVAETLQTAFLPQTLPRSNGTRLDAAYLAAGEDSRVGGDWYDVVEMPDGRLLLCVGDVTGHGLSAAVTASKLRQTAISTALAHSDPAEILGVLNRVLRFQHPETYATAILAFLEPACGRLSYACAGHPPPLLASSEGASDAELIGGGLPLGIDAEVDFTTHHVSLPENSVVALYTDGLTEFSRDIASAESALKHAVAALAANPQPKPAEAIVRQVLRETRPSDDVVLLLVQHHPKISDHADSHDGCIDAKRLRFHSADQSAASEARAALAEVSKRLSLESETAFAAQLILGEALANVVQHAPGMVEVSIAKVDEHLVLAILDEGGG
ncbi:MAG: SpoIIE family protein phosphatase, partial [Candidatus Eremiobacteraeota bacterium]|nr:SpoIIE family protein phosphatase [Candidatus Eremiobacteraeota bacterium]